MLGKPACVCAGYEVLTAATVKSTRLWDMTPTYHHIPEDNTLHYMFHYHNAEQNPYI
jgi:hypothetical protein